MKITGYIMMAIVLMSSCNSGIHINAEEEDFSCFNESEYKKLNKETKSIDLDEIDSLKVKIIMSAGRLNLNGKTKKLFNIFHYIEETFDPQIIEYNYLNHK